MRKGVLAAACAAAMLWAGQAAAATFTVDFAVSGPWSQFEGTAAPFGLNYNSALTGSFTGDTALLTTPPGPIGGAEMLTSFQLTAGSQSYALADVIPALSWVQIVGGDVIFGLGIGDSFIGNNNSAIISDGVNAIACDGCVVDTSLTWSGDPSPTPEPATWAMMLLGFLGLGAALRTRRELSFN